MKFAKLAIFVLFAALLIFAGCGKDKEKGNEEVSIEGTEQDTVVVTITQAEIDSFLKVFPEVQGVIEGHRAELEEHGTDSPVDKAETNKIMETIEEEMADVGVDQEWFFAVYQKIIMGGMYLNSVRQAQSLQPENIQMKIEQLQAMLDSQEIDEGQKVEIQQQITQLKSTKQQVVQSKAQLTEMKAQLADPETPDSLKPRLQASIQQLERVFNPGETLPEGLSQQELNVIEQNLPQIIATLEKYSPEQPQAQQQGQPGVRMVPPGGSS